MSNKHREVFFENASLQYYNKNAQGALALLSDRGQKLSISDGGA